MSLKKTNTNSLLAKKLAAYSAVAVAVIGTSTNDAKAIIEYTDIVPDDSIFQGSGSIFIDFDNDTVNDVQFKMDFKVALSQTYRSIWIQGLNGAKVLGIPSQTWNFSLVSWYSSVVPMSGSYNAVYNMNKYSVIGSSGSFFGGFQPMAAQWWSKTTFQTAIKYGLWPGSVNKYVGVQFVTDSNTHYGWIRVDVSQDGDLLVVKDYGWEMDSGVSIGAGLISFPADTAMNVAGDDIGDNLNGTDLEFTFDDAANLAMVDSYRVMAVKAGKAGSFNREAADTVKPNDYVVVAKGGGTGITGNFGALGTDSDGDTIRNNSQFVLFVLSIADGVNAQINGLSNGSPLVTLQAQSSPALNVTGADVADNSDANDLEWAFDEAADETKVKGYRVMVVKSANAASFDLTAADAVVMANYHPVDTSVALTSHTGNWPIPKFDVDGDAVVNGSPYKLFVLSMADGLNAQFNVLSGASNEVTLLVTLVVDSALNVLAQDVSNNKDATDMQVKFDAATAETGIDEYKIMAVKQPNAATFDLTAAEAVAAGNFKAVTPAGNANYQALMGGILDVDGDSIVEGVVYSVFIHSSFVAPGTAGNLSASDTVILSSIVGIDDVPSQFEGLKVFSASDRQISVMLSKELSSEAKIEIYSLDGKLVSSNNVTGLSTTVSIADGNQIYLVHLRDQSYTYNSKVYVSGK